MLSFEIIRSTLFQLIPHQKIGEGIADSLAMLEVYLEVVEAVCCYLCCSFSFSVTEKQYPGKATKRSRNLIWIRISVMVSWPHSCGHVIKCATLVFGDCSGEKILDNISHEAQTGYIAC